MSKRAKIIRDCALNSGVIALVGAISGPLAVRILDGAKVPSRLYVTMVVGTLAGAAIWFAINLVWAFWFVSDDTSA